VRQILRHWVAQHPLPINGRTRLLIQAASARKVSGKSFVLPFPDFTRDFFAWAMVYSMGNSVSALRLVS
jgi:hypothetical protein